MGVAVAREGEHADADGDEEDGDEGGFEAVLLAGFLVAVGVVVGHEVDVGEVGEEADEAAEHDAGAGDGDLVEGEAVFGHVGDGQGVEEGVVGGVTEARVQVDEVDRWVEHADLHGFDEGVLECGPDAVVEGFLC